MDERVGRYTPSGAAVSAHGRPAIAATLPPTLTTVHATPWSMLRRAWHSPADLWLVRGTRTADLVLALPIVTLVAAGARVAGAWSLPALIGAPVRVADALLIACAVVVWGAALALCGAYDPDRSPTCAVLLRNTLAGSTFGAAAIVTMMLASSEHLPGVASALVLWFGTATAVLVVRGAGRLSHSSRRARAGRQRIVIAGTGPRAAALWLHLRRDPRARYDLIAVTDVAGALPAPGMPVREHVPLASLEDYLMRTVVDEVHVALPVRSRYAEIEQVLLSCERAGVHARYLTDTFAHGIARPRLGKVGGAHLMGMHVVQDDWRLLVKRVIGAVGAAIGLLVLSPLLLGIAIAVRLSGPGPIIFVQERYGLRRRRFPMYKFRTMVPDAERRLAELEALNEADGHAFKMRDDPRVTRVGRILRRTSLDELPQLVNVLKGDMALVGPRPMSMRDVSRFDEIRLVRRFSVRPGLTCLWQVSGRSDTTFDEWMDLDLRYIDQWSLSLDFRILLQTVPAVLKGRGAA